nr:MAG TPA: hypothetical protein [Herelleviridae sp.]
MWRHTLKRERGGVGELFFQPSISSVPYIFIYRTSSMSR